MASIRSFFRRTRSKDDAPRRLHRRRASKSAPAPPDPQPPSPAAVDLERVFRKFDANGDGRISSSELRAIFDSLGHALSDDELASMMAEADSDGDGFISLAEFADLNTRGVGPDQEAEDVREAFAVFDLDRNGAISPDELAKVLRSIGERATAAQCRRMIGGVDLDGDGLISFDEFRAMMANGSSFAASFGNARK